MKKQFRFRLEENELEKIKLRVQKKLGKELTYQDTIEYIFDFYEKNQFYSQLSSFKFQKEILEEMKFFLRSFEEKNMIFTQNSIENVRLNLEIMNEMMMKYFDDGTKNMNDIQMELNKFYAETEYDIERNYVSFDDLIETYYEKQ